MPKKKTPINGFALFMKDYRKRQEEKGIRYANMQEVSEHAGLVWRTMSEEEKAEYNNRAKQIKGEDKNDLSKKFTSLGVSYQEIENERLRKEEEENIMVTYIRTLLNSLEFEDAFTKKVFYLIHTNYFYKNDNHVFKPAEIAIVQFNLSRGLLKRFHRFIDSGDIETGFRSEVRAMTDYHGIPCTDEKTQFGEKDYGKLFVNIIKFLEDGIEEKGRLPPLYTMPNNVNQNTCKDAVVSTLNTLCDAVGEDPDIFRVYPLPNLFHEMRQKALLESDFGKHIDHKLISLPMATRDIEKDPFQYCKGSSCTFHDEKDLGHVCSLSVASRWVFSICDHMLGYIPDNVIPNGHVPLDCETALKSARVAQAFASGNMKSLAVVIQTDGGPVVESDIPDLDASEGWINVEPARRSHVPAPTPKVQQMSAASVWSASQLEQKAKKEEPTRRREPVADRPSAARGYAAATSGNVGPTSYAGAAFERGPSASQGGVPDRGPTASYAGATSARASSVSYAGATSPRAASVSSTDNNVGASESDANQSSASNPRFDRPNDDYWPPIGRGGGRGNPMMQSQSTVNSWSGGGRGAMLRRQFTQSQGS